MNEIITQIKKEWKKIIIAIPIIFIVFGTIIKNLFLSSFGLSDFSIFKSESITIGIVFIAFCVVLYFSSFALVDKENLLKKKFILLLIQQLLKLLSFSAFFHYLFETMKIGGKIEGSQIEIISQYIIVFSFNVLISSIILHYNIIVLSSGKDDKFWRRFRKFIKCMIWCCLIFASLFCIYHSIYDSSLRKLIMIVLAFFILPLSKYSGKRIADEEKNDIAIEKIKKEKNLGINSVIKELFTAIAFLLVAVIIFMFGYSKVIFPLLPLNIGGGMSNELTIIFKDKTEFIGKTILSNSEFIYAIDKNNDVLVFEWADINKLKQVNENTSIFAFY
ncbi:MAG: hypothetical protein WCN92_00455 [Eubacteriales bacterium]